jgi:hypothetical protein
MKRRVRRGVAALGVLAAMCCGCSSSRPVFDAMPFGVNNLSAVLGPITGTGSRTLTVTASRAMSITMGCIGKGMLIIVGPLSAGAVLCGDASSSEGSFASYYWSHVSVRPGERIRLRVVTDATTLWDVRVDGAPRNGGASCADC